MILQQRVFSKKRVLYKIGTVKKEEFSLIVEKLKRYYILEKELMTEKRETQNYEI